MLQVNASLRHHCPNPRSPLPPAMEKAAPTAVARKRESDGIAGSRPRNRARGGNYDGNWVAEDPISRLPDAILGTIISLLPTKDGERTQALSRRWHHLWCSAPLHLQANSSLCSSLRWRPTIINRILSDHPGPARRFHFPFIQFTPGDIDSRRTELDGWCQSRALDGLQELNIYYGRWSREPPHISFLLPTSALRFAPTLLVLKIGSCNFPSEISPSLSFPLLKQLILRCVSISEDVFDQVLSGCRALESLQLWDILTARRLHIRSLTLRSIGSRARSACTQELVIEDAPCLERFVSLYPPDISFETIRVIGAPKLKILGLFSPCVSTLQIATLVVKGMSPVSLANSICTVKVLALYSSGSQLNAVLNILRCFPRLEKLYFTLKKHPKMDMKNVHLCDPLDPIECLAIHLKKLVFENYKGRHQDADFAKFFILTAKVLKEIKISSPKGNDIKWVDDQHKLLQVEDRASRDAGPEFRSEFSCLGKTKQIHDLLDDPFDCSCCRIKCNVLSGESCP
ncbi:FBD-associated F-box protein At5g60610 isoform X1 [Aegilops tauschii subsp. strangulata]|nr:FBD-associated F-box protein At5g60610 isoform X1 [Aegilops tauschii subsp. strangulata]